MPVHTSTTHPYPRSTIVLSRHSRPRERYAWLLLVCAALLVLAGSGDSAWAKGQPAGKGKGGDGPSATHTYGGEATALSVTAAGNVLTVTEAGPIDAGGGVDEASLLSADLGAASASVLSAVVVGEGDTTTATASVADLAVDVDSVAVTASVLVSESSVTCVDGVASPTGNSVVADLALEVAGVTIPVVVDGSSNQTVDLLGLGTLVINEQIVAEDGSSASITTNALHLTVDTVSDGFVEVVVSNATASMTCDPGGPAGTSDDWFTGGGTHFGTPSGDRASFGVAGGVRNGGYWGHLNFVDHGGIHVQAVTITAYEVLDETTRRISGKAKVGKARVDYVATVSDNGEPGVDDTFELELSNGYRASGTLEGGNIQLHPTR